MLRSSLRVALFTCLLGVVTACGQKGDLVKPGAEPPRVTASPASAEGN